MTTAARELELVDAKCKGCKRVWRVTRNAIPLLWCPFCECSDFEVAKW